MVTRLLAASFLVLSVWVVAHPAPAAAKPGELATTLYRLEPTYGRTLQPLNPRTLADFPVSGPAYIIAPFSTRVVTVQPTLVMSPRGTTVAVSRYDCPGCQGMVTKYLKIRVVNLMTNTTVGSFHPPVPISLGAVSDDGSRISGFRMSSTGTCCTTWVTIDTHSHQVISTIPLPDTLYTVVPDPATNRVYVASSSTSHHLILTAYAADTGAQLSRQDLTVSFGSWPDASGHEMTDMVDPGMALSQDGKRFAIYDGSALTLLDAVSLKVLSTRTVSRPTSLAQRLGTLLGLLPEPALAKGIPGPGVSLGLQFSRDGQSLYVTGAMSQPDGSGHYAWKAIGLQRIDVQTGQLAVQGLKDQVVVWLGMAADGSAVYALTAATGAGCPCALQRLDPETLQSTAEREFDQMPDLVIVGG